MRVDKILGEDIDKLLIVKIVMVENGIIKKRLHSVVQVSSSLPHLSCWIGDDAGQLFKSGGEHNQTVIVEKLENVVDGADGPESDFIRRVIEEFQNAPNQLLKIVREFIVVANDVTNPFEDLND